MEMQSPTPDHDLLIEVNTNVKNLTATLNTYTSSNTSTMNDHESRLRAVESESQRLKGAQWILGGLVVIIGIVLAAFQVFYRG